MRARPSPRAWGGVWLWILAGFMVPSCMPPPKQRVVVEETRLQEVDAHTWDNGVRAFHRGEFQKALEIFQDLRESGETDEVRRRGLYGLACVRLILAENARDFHHALSLWEEWSRAAPMGREVEDPRMMSPLLYRVKPPIETPQAITPDATESRRRAACEGRLRDQEREIQHLKHQLEALEAIHQQIQEKKREATSP